MAGHHRFSWKPADLFWVVISLLVLPPIVYYPYSASTKRLPFGLLHDGKERTVEVTLGKAQQ